MSLRLTLTGQALITHDLCAASYSGLAAVADELRRGAVVFTDLEATMAVPASGSPARPVRSVRSATYLHVAEPAVVDCLRTIGFNLVALANNHAGDLGPAGVVATRDVVAGAGLGHAGSGRTLAEATRPGYVEAAGHRVGLVAMATGNLHGSAATPRRAGVNELRVGTDDRPDPTDAARNLAAVGAAAGESDVVIAYLHNHHRDRHRRSGHAGSGPAGTSDWARRWARACIDAGARVFVSHGTPLLQGIEWYRGCPLFHGLGNVVFHSRTAPGHYPPQVWESVLAHCRITGREVTIELVPIILNELGDDPARQHETRGRPRLATGADAARVLDHLAALSEPFGVAIDVTGDRGVVRQSSETGTATGTGW